MRRLGAFLLAAGLLCGADPLVAQFAPPESSKAQWTLRQMFVQNGAFGLAPYAADPFTCSAATERATYYNTATHLNMFCNGTTWGAMGGSGGSSVTYEDAASSPQAPTSADTGTLFYSSTIPLTLDLSGAAGAGVRIGAMAYGGAVTITGSSASLYGVTCNSITSGPANTEIPQTIWFVDPVGFGQFQVEGFTGVWYCNGSSMFADESLRPAGLLLFMKTWVNADVAALGAATSGDISVGFPSFADPGDFNFRVRAAMIRITGQGAGTTTLTVALGKTGAAYVDWVVASSAKAAAGTVYGDALAEHGASLQSVVGDVSFASTWSPQIHFISTGANLDQVTGSTGTVYIWYELIP